MKKRRRRRRSPQKVSRYRRVVGRLSHSMLALAVVTVGLTFGLASVGWAVNGKPLLAGNHNTETRPTVLENTGTGPALDLRIPSDSGPALAVNTDGLVTNLNADKLDGLGEDAFAKNGHKHSGADITSDTVGELFIDEAITRDSEVESLVGDSFATQSALNDKRAAREAADTTLQNNINAEARARNNSDQTLQGNINAEVADTTLDSNMNQLRSSLQQATGQPNDPSDLVDWSNLKGVPAGFADGEDAVGSSGAGDNVVVERRELAKPPINSTAANTEVVFDAEAFEIRAECKQVTGPLEGELISVPVPNLYVVAKEPNVLV
jgi:hypothetical protein